MILSKSRILKELSSGGLVIKPFNEINLNPNSYNLTLHDELMIYTDPILDMYKANNAYTFKIPEEGFVIEPNTLYLARTAEWTETEKFVPVLEGRSSIGRLGINVHATAGFGDVGFKGYWTLELSCVQPVRIYAGTRICQIVYHTVSDYFSKYDGKYQHSGGIQGSRLYLEGTE